MFCYHGIKALEYHLSKSKKSNLHYTRHVTPKRVTSCWAHLRGLAPGQHSSKEASMVASRWRQCVDLTGPGIQPQTSRIDSVRSATELTAGYHL